MDRVQYYLEIYKIGGNVYLIYCIIKLFIIDFIYIQARVVNLVLQCRTLNAQHSFLLEISRNLQDYARLTHPVIYVCVTNPSIQL